MSGAQRRRLGALTADDVARLDAAAARLGVETLQLMEVAGWQVARCVWRMVRRRRRARILVVSGRGNNGGDALVAARHLDTWGCDVRACVIAAATEPRETVQHHLGALRAAGVAARILRADQLSMLDAEAGAAEVVIDGLLGTGLRSAPRPPDEAAIAALAGARVCAVDVPSGLDVDTGTAAGACVRAEVTCTLTAMKVGLWEPVARSWAGRIVVGDIGMPRAAWRECGLEPPRAIRGGALITVPLDGARTSSAG